MRTGVLGYVSNILNDYILALIIFFHCIHSWCLEMLVCAFEGFKRLETKLSIPKGYQSFKMQVVKQCTCVNTSCENYIQKEN